MNFKEELQSRTSQIEAILEAYLPKEEGPQRTVIEAMNYSVRVGGKRLRPMLMQETYRMFGGEGNLVEPFMAAMEMIHTYSLVHDDLPAMDNDEYRRGQLTTHKKYGEAEAILAGDGLLNYAFETALKAFEMQGEPAAVAKAMQILAKKAGIYGMIGGQTADIEAESMGDKVTREQLLFIHEHKTAALIQASMMIGAVLAGATDEQVMLMEQAAYEVGVAFQIQDDILDVTSTLEVLGKPTGSDEKNHKTTYVTLKGLEQATKEQQEMSTHAISILESLEQKNEFLVELIRSLITRMK
ncbi:MAG: polyprenyl synthetase family protein [Lachnospiraceae bacterium]|nr:polyprenyl synthetase family protein [Lachnospiraceae bacterium]